MDKVSVCKKWTEEYVIGLNLCPFAADPMRRDRIHFRVQEEMNNADDDILAFFHSDFDSVFWIFDLDLSFDEYLHRVEVLYGVLDLLNLVEELKIVTFHPEHLYEGVGEEEAVNFANRSPLPMVQFLRKQQLVEIGMTEDWKMEILHRNETTLTSIGTERLKKKLDEYRKAD